MIQVKRLEVACDHCSWKIEFPSRCVTDPRSEAPPPGWTEIREGGRTLGRHLCPDCLPTVGGVLELCGLNLSTTPIPTSAPTKKP